MIDLIVLYFTVGLIVCMVLFGDSLGAFPLWILPVWPLMALIFVAGEAWFEINHRLELREQ